MNDTKIETMYNTTNPNFARTTSALFYAKAVLMDRAEEFRKSGIEDVAKSIETQIKLIKTLINERYGM